MTNVPPSGGPEYRTSYLVGHPDGRDKYVVMAFRRGTWMPMLYGEDKMQLSIDAASAGLGAPKELTYQSTAEGQRGQFQATEETLALIAGHTDVMQWTAREAYDKIQAVASLPIGTDPSLTHEEVRKLYEDAKEMLNRPDNPLKGSVEEQINDLDATIRAQHQLEEQAEALVDAWKDNPNISDADKAMAQAELERQVKASMELEARAQLLDDLVNGVAPPPTHMQYVGLDDEQLSIDLEAGHDALARAVEGHDPDDPPEASAEPAKPNKPTGPSDTGAEAEAAAYTFADGLGASADAMPSSQEPMVETDVPRPGQVGSQSHADAMAFAEAQLAQYRGGTPIEDLARLDYDKAPTASARAAIISSRTFPDASAAATENRPTLAAAKGRGKTKVAGKVLKRGGRR